MDTDVKRVVKRLEELYNCGRQLDGTFSRVAFSPEDIKGREKYISYFTELGLTSRTDKAGNLIIRMEGKNPKLPSILIGSHLDTVPNGGKYDGVLGCVAGLEICETLLASHETLNHPLEVIVFTDEEGFRFGSGLTGSSAFCGIPTGVQDEDTDMYGMKRAEIMKAYNITAANVSKANRASDTVHCFIELHVEQGASLYKEQKQIGVVSTIAGVSRYEITVNGQANHSGSTMMCDRKDALVEASKFIAVVPDIISEYGEAYTVGTVGTMRVLPNSVNVIPSSCVFNLEIRDQNAEVMKRVETKLKECLEQSSYWDENNCTFRQISYHAPAPMSDWVKNTIQQAVERKGYGYRIMPSGAFHDSLVMSTEFPTGMIFIPSVEGVSHSPQEKSLEQDIEKGCNVLLETVLAVDKE